MELSRLIKMPTTGPDRESWNGRTPGHDGKSSASARRMADEPVLRGKVELQPVRDGRALSQHPSPIMMLVPPSVGATWT
jgi:hypothetical protein